jgi:hypothetical protein
MKLTIENIAEYFLGTKTLREYQAEENFYREFVTEKIIVKEYLRLSKITKTAFIISGKVIPNILDIYGCVYSIQTGDFPTPIIIGEVVRLGCSIMAYQDKIKICKQITKIEEEWNSSNKGKILIKNLENLCKDDEE